MPKSGIDEAAGRLLGAFHDLSGEKLNEPVPLTGSEEDEGAAEKAGIDPRGTGCEVAVRYLLDHNYLQEVEGGRSLYTITVPGLERVREMRGTA